MLARSCSSRHTDFREEGHMSSAVRRDRVSRVALTLLENIDAISEALSIGNGYRPAGLAEAFEATSWVTDG